ncbi:MAG: ribonuclease HI family protein [Candidatus Micrarchaeota archaeon]|nr:ribonuclease HI family protein [Candidatus Micrarchaeota archaeon]
MGDRVTVYTDGAARGNPGPSASGYMIMQGSKTVRIEMQYNGVKTNNYAEYHAIEMALGWCLDNLQSPSSAKISVFSDSELVVRQLNGRYKTKVSKLRDLKRRVSEIASKFGSVAFENLPREDRHISRVDHGLNMLLDETLRKGL